MKFFLLKLQGSRGQGLIEALVGFAILLILFHALASLVITSYDLLGNTRTRTNARHLANEKMEEIRNMSFAAVGVVGGIPSGDIPPLQTVNLNGLDYTVRATVIFIDDEFDQLAPTDPYPTDFKRIRVDVSWTGRFVAGESITLITDLTSDVIVAGGTLSILVFDADAQPVPQANVHIVNTAVSPQIDVNLLTNDEGKISLPGTPVCDTCYQITVSKTGFSTDRTYSTAEVPNPAKPHTSVIEAMLTEVSFAIDQTSTMSFHSTRSREENFATMSYQTFFLRGNKTIGTNALGDPVYKYETQLVTDQLGNKTVNNLEWDNYLIYFRDIDSRDLSGINPLSPLPLIPASEIEAVFATAPHTANSLLLAVVEASGSAIASASARLTGPGGYDQTVFAGFPENPDSGQSFFPSLQIATYQLELTKPGYEPKTESVEVEGRTQTTVYLDVL